MTYLDLRSIIKLAYNVVANPRLATVAYHMLLKQYKKSKVGLPPRYVLIIWRILRDHRDLTPLLDVMEVDDSQLGRALSIFLRTRNHVDLYDKIDMPDIIALFVDRVERDDPLYDRFLNVYSHSISNIGTYSGIYAIYHVTSTHLTSMPSNEILQGFSLCQLAGYYGHHIAYRVSIERYLEHGTYPYFRFFDTNVLSYPVLLNLCKTYIDKILADVVMCDFIYANMMRSVPFYVYTGSHTDDIDVRIRKFAANEVKYTIHF